MKALALIQFLKALACLGAVFAAYLVSLHKKGRVEIPKKHITAILLVLALFSGMAYLDFGMYPKHGTFMNPHDFFHYYLGSKYWSELGYFDLYRGVVVANAEENGRPMHRSLRNLNTYRSENARTVLNEAERYKGRFEPARWDLFKKDVAYFESITASKRWPGVVGDKGYNATPVWNMVASFLTNRVAPTDSPGAMFFLVSLDFLLLFALLLLVWAAFGPWVMFLTAIYFGAHFMMSFPHIRGGFLRLDWVMLTAMSVCLVKLGRYGLSGALLGYAAMSRIFPIIFVFGMGAKMIFSLLRTRRIEKRYAAFFTAFALVLSALLGASVIHDGGLDHWRDFYTKITLHNDDLSPSRVGFKYLFLDTFSRDKQPWQTFEDEKLALFEERKVSWWVIQALVLALTFFAARKLEDYEAIPLGYVPVFFLTASTFYYQVMLIVPFLLFAAKLERVGYLAGVALLFGMCVAWYALRVVWPLDLALSYTVSCTLFALSGYMIAVAFSVPAPEDDSALTSASS